MALSFGENLGVLGNIKITDVKLVAGAFRTIASGSDTGSITVQRVEDGQIVYIQSEDRLIKASKAGASVNWSNFYFPTASVDETAGIFVATGSSFNTTNDLEITGSLTTTVTGSFGSLVVGGSSFDTAVSASAVRGGFGSGGGSDLDSIFEEDGNGDLQPATTTSGLSVFYEYDGNNDIIPRQ
tara:strand:- start:7612 stop:8160 length:549 start_codon:yes stop_codon:yes gene_type:complete